MAMGITGILVSMRIRGVGGAKYNDVIEDRLDERRC